MSATLEKVIGLLEEQTGVSGDAFDEDSLLTEWGVDSLDTIELFLCIESEFDISISDEEIEEIKTLGDIAEIVEKKFKPVVD